MLRPLPFIAMRQQHHEAAHAQPFAFARKDELVDDDLRAIGEIAELRFPQHERVRLGHRVSIFEAEHGRFGQHAVDDLEPVLAADLGQRHIALFGFLIDERGMALAERAARRILSAQANPEAFLDQRAESERLGGGPVEPLAGLEHLLLGLQNTAERAVDIEALRHRRQDLAESLEPVSLDAGIAAPGLALRDLETGPAALEPVGFVGPVVLARLEFLLQNLAEVRDHFVGLARL